MAGSCDQGWDRQGRPRPPSPPAGDPGGCQEPQAWVRAGRSWDLTRLGNQNSSSSSGGQTRATGCLPGRGGGVGHRACVF